jgi:hypothetical protein
LWDEENGAEGDSLFVVIPDRMDPTNLIQLKNGKKVKTIVIPKFQSLKYLTLAYSNGILKNDTLTLDVTLTNESGHIIKFNHPSMPLIGFNQHKMNEILTTPLIQITGKEQIAPNERISFKYTIPLNLVDNKQSILVFTQTIDRNRGKMVAVDIADYKSN